ncbi:MAG: kinase, partial [Candidatus Saccharibacteria bacterium]|nr:kinase [Pseudorhodobacter sp.]
MTIIKLTTVGGKPVEYVDEIIGQGGMKDVYFSPDKSYVVAFFRDKLDYQGKERLKSIIGPYRDGVVVPAYLSYFFFAHGSVNDDMLEIKGREKEGKWFASASNRSKFLVAQEKGSWLTHLQITLMISRAVRRPPAAGRAPSRPSSK